ncbi:MAG: hypothetical protein Q9184_000280 [Pyrenodesmia sp. 2 TL-2023]
MTDIAAHLQRAPLAQIWRFICAERQLTKADVLDTDIQIEITRMIQSAAAPMSLRVNSQLLLGVVRVYKQKVRFLLDDCDQVITQIRLMVRKHVQSSSTPTTRRRSSFVIASPAMAFVSGTGSTPNCVPQDQCVVEDVIIDSSILMADLETNIQAYIDGHNFGRPKRTFAQTIQAEKTEATQQDKHYDSDYGDVELDLDLGDSPSFDAPVMRSLSCGSAELSPSPYLYQHAQTSPEVCSEPVEAVKSELKRTRKRRRVLTIKDEETVISLAELKKQQLDRSNILRPRAPRSAALGNLQRTLSNNFVLSLVQGSRHCAPELRQYLNIDFIRANAVASDDASYTPELQLRESDNYTEDDLVSNQSDCTSFEARSDEDIQFSRNRLTSAASGGTRLFQDAVLGLSKQDVTACFLELLVLATQGHVVKLMDRTLHGIQLVCTLQCLELIYASVRLKASDALYSSSECYLQPNFVDILGKFSPNMRCVAERMSVFRRWNVQLVPTRVILLLYVPSVVLLRVGNYGTLIYESSPITQ